MSLMREIAGELWGMFVADARMTLSVLAVILVAALLATAWPALAGPELVLGVVGVLLGAILRSARR